MHYRGRENLGFTFLEATAPWNSSGTCQILREMGCFHNIKEPYKTRKHLGEKGADSKAAGTDQVSSIDFC